jgi:hypothetical protein
MDDLPDLSSDADVDALMARLRSKLPAASPPSPRSDAPPAPTEESDDCVALEAELASLIARAMQVVSDTLDDLETDGRTERVTSAPRSRSSRTRQRRTRRKTR